MMGGTYHRGLAQTINHIAREDLSQALRALETRDIDDGARLTAAQADAMWNWVMWVAKAASGDGLEFAQDVMRAAAQMPMIVRGIK